MDRRSSRRWRFLSLFLTALHLNPSLCSAAATKVSPRTYIIHMAKSEMPGSFSHHREWYASTVRSITGASSSTKLEAEDPARRILYSYETAFHGFAARLSEAEAEQLESSGIPGVVSVLRRRCTSYTRRGARSSWA
uniref:Inhibitor I9 domain-containing protein n=1 Tax=Ananas comosus var. bracteatus TaxID=296719 RepID=A0A6V7QMV7_ANACO|nr:unnamed protein product [Ananas comosus var. bracteatus]